MQEDKTIRISSKSHKMIKIQAAKKGLSMKGYIDSLVIIDEHDIF